jgi:rhodanese-related sulfurtransferase
MRDNSKKPARMARIVAAAALVAFSAAAGKPCSMELATTGEKDQPTEEITTDQMEAAVVQIPKGVLVVDARPYEEFAMSHVPGAVDVSDVGEIQKLARGKKDRTIVLYGDGPFHGKSKQLAQDLLNAGYTHVVRYQLGIPVWRALGHPTQVEADAIGRTLDKDKTAVVIDAREPGAFGKGTLPGARHVTFADVAKANEDGRLPVDHSTRIFVVGKDEAQALAVAQEIAKSAFSNVSFFAGSIDSLASR